MQCATIRRKHWITLSPVRNRSSFLWGRGAFMREYSVSGICYNSLLKYRPLIFKVSTYHGNTIVQVSLIKFTFMSKCKNAFIIPLHFKKCITITYNVLILSTVSQCLHKSVHCPDLGSWFICNKYVAVACQKENLGLSLYVFKLKIKIICCKFGL